MIELTNNADIKGLDLRMRVVMKKVEKIYKAHGHDLTITCGLDGEHSAGSMHYYGLALDFRTRWWGDEEAEQVAQEIRHELDHTFYVAFEKNHIHVNLIYRYAVEE